MKWERVQAMSPSRCSARGCEIAAGSEQWIKRWRSTRASGRLESVYCPRCAHGSRCASGPLKLGPVILLILAAVSFGLLPLVWPGHVLRYLAVFLVLFSVTALLLTRTFFRWWGQNPRLTVTLSQFAVRQPAEQPIQEPVATVR